MWRASDTPAGIDLTPPSATDQDFLTTTELWQSKTGQTGCIECHKNFDPLAYGLEHYDPIGRWRTEDEFGLGIDAAGAIRGHAAPNGSDTKAYEGPLELSQALAESPVVQACVLERWYTFAQGRIPLGPHDECALKRLGQRFERSGYNLRQMVLDVVEEESFYYRQTQRDAP